VFEVHAHGAGGQQLLPFRHLGVGDRGGDDQEGHGRGGQLAQHGARLVRLGLAVGERQQGAGQLGPGLRPQDDEAPREQLAVVRGAGAQGEDARDLLRRRTGQGQGLGGGGAAAGEPILHLRRGERQGQGGSEIGVGHAA
jgi:hypothetical protein